MHWTLSTDLLVEGLQLKRERFNALTLFICAQRYGLPDVQHAMNFEFFIAIERKNNRFIETNFEKFPPRWFRFKDMNVYHSLKPKSVMTMAMSYCLVYSNSMRIKTSNVRIQSNEVKSFPKVLNSTELNASSSDFVISWRLNGEVIQFEVEYQLKILKHVGLLTQNYSRGVPNKFEQKLEIEIFSPGFRTLVFIISK